MTRCEIVYFKTERGDEPVKNFVDALDLSARRKYWRVIEYLRQFGKSLPEPHAKYLGGELYELRFRGSEGHFRILYFFFSGHYAVLANAFKKKTNKVVKHEISLATQRMNTFLENAVRYGI